MENPNRDLRVPLWERVALTVAQHIYVTLLVLVLFLFALIALINQRARVEFDRCARGGGVISYSETGANSCTPRGAGGRL